MDIPALQHAASGNDWFALWPELAVGGLALVLLLIDLLCPRRSDRLIPGAAICGQLVILAALGGSACSLVERETFNGLIRLSHSGEAMRGFFLLSSILVCTLGWVPAGSAARISRKPVPPASRPFSQAIRNNP